MLSVKDFLKKYTTISNNFIDDFFELYDNNSVNTDFLLDADVICKWLNIRKDTIKKLLKHSYNKNIDYIVERIKKEKGSGSGATLKEKILLTPLFKYKDYIIQGLQEKIKKLENNQKPKVYPKKGVIYAFETPNSPHNSLYKIGKTKDLKQRLKSHQSPLSDDINILYYFETDDIDSVEKCAKMFMKKFQYRKYKEVYQVNIDIIKDVVSNCGKISENIKIKEGSKEDNKYYLHISKE